MKRLYLSFCLSLCCLLPALAGQNDSPDNPLTKNLPWRNIGPAIMGGRIDDFAVVESNPSIVYVGTASGGVFKSINHGTTWEAIFDNQEVSSIGDVTVAPSNPDIVWVGSGEANNRQSSSWGNGIYKSSDAGKTWTYMGLPESRHIGRIVIDPRNPDVVYVAAGGSLWGPSKERGLYKTTDGGKTWTQSLAINADTGCTDVAIDLQNPDTLYAAAYQRRRTASGFNGGGPGSGLYKTTDGGATWKKLTSGLPDTDMGRIGLDIYRKNPQIVYACIENKTNGGIYRSEDRGETWKKMGSVNQGLNAFRPMYFSQIRVDPNDDQHIIMAGVRMGYSTDGGKTVRADQLGRLHDDVHAIWIDPANSNHILVGCDGGIQWSYDGTKTWDYVNTLSLAQFYEVTYDMRKPYWVYGGLQDNGSWGAPSSTLTARGVTNDEWVNVGGGDGFYVRADPMDSNTIYSESQQGALSRMNVATGERKSIRPRPKPGEPAYHFNWNSPLLISTHDHNKILFGGNRLFISNDRGDSWRSTDDLSTKPDRTKIPIMGVLPSPNTLSLNDGQDSFGEIITISESPRQAGLLYVGTDDGNLQVSHDDGLTWKNVAERVPGLPKGTHVSRVLTSNYVPGRAYATFDNHRSDDYKPYVYVTEDRGDTWRSLTANLPEGGTVKAIQEHPRNPDLLFVGTERGLFVSLNRGGEWAKLGAPFPTVPVNDIQIHPRDNDLIVATHGRGIWILDDITPMEQMAGKGVTREVALFPPVPAAEFRFWNHKAVTGNRIFTATNPPPGAIIQYYLKTKPASGAAIKLAILDKNGKTVVREIRNIPAEAGLNRVIWDLRAGVPTVTGTPASTDYHQDLLDMTLKDSQEDEDEKRDDDEEEEQERDEVNLFARSLLAFCQTADPEVTPRRRGQGGGGTGAGRPGGAAGVGGQGGAPGGGRPGGGRQGGGGQGGGFGGFLRGPRVMPGTYLVRLTIGTEEQTQPIQVSDDPRIKLTDRDRKARYDLQMRALSLFAAFNEAQRTARTLRTQVTTLQSSAGLKEAPQPVKDSVASFAKQVTEAQTRLTEGRNAAARTTTSPGETSAGETPRTEAGETPITGGPPGGAPPNGVPGGGPPGPGGPGGGGFGGGRGGLGSGTSGRIIQIVNSLESITEMPSKSVRQECDEVAAELKQAVAEINALNATLPTLNKKLSAGKIAELKPGDRIPTPR